MSERIATFTYAGHPGPVRPRDGYVNITALCQAEGKRNARDTILRSREATRFLEVVAQKTQICVISLVEKRQRAGTWVHPLVASWLAERLSGEAAFFVQKTLEELHLVGVVTELAERQIAVEGQIAERVAERVRENLEARRRRRPSQEVRRRHLQCAALYYDGRCPRCQGPIGKPQIDHFCATGDNALENTWPICGGCNQRRAGVLHAKERHEERRAFELYLENLEAFLRQHPELDPRRQLDLPS